MQIRGSDGRIGNAVWWAQALAYSVIAGSALGVVGPFGSFLNDDVLVRVVHFVGLTLAGTILAGVLGPLILRLGNGIGAPALFSTGIVMIVVAGPVSVLSAVVTTWLWPAYTSQLGPVDWFAQALLITVGVVSLWLLLEAAITRAQSAPAHDPELLEPEDGQSVSDILCLQMEDHYVRIHQATSARMELLPLRDAITRYGTGDGLQVHRSWWVARKAVAEVERDARSLRLRLANGLLVPVARNRVAALRENGWLNA